jgi:KipI family sensor histidine kinase inhibitor
VSVNILRYGERALLLEVGSHLVADYVAALEHLELSEITGIVPAAQTILVQLRSASDVGSIQYRLADLQPIDVGDIDVGEVRIDVDYDGPDLAWVAEQTGLSPDDVVALHSAAIYRVQFCGFSPGYGYLSGLDPLLQLPRRDSPRTSVPAGSVAIADAYSCVYPSSSPGGWHILGSTDAVLFDPDRFDIGESPALFQPGLTVRFFAR